MRSVYGDAARFKSTILPVPGVYTTVTAPEKTKDGYYWLM